MLFPSFVKSGRLLALSAKHALFFFFIIIITILTSHADRLVASSTPSNIASRRLNFKPE
jgi:hypothetical protein